MSILINKSYKEYDYVSRYSPFPYYYNTQDDKYVSGVTAYLDNTTSYTMHTVASGDSLDSIALQYYNNPTYYWIICSFNRITNPFEELKVGQQLKVPSLSTIKFDKEGRS